MKKIYYLSIIATMLISITTNYAQINVGGLPKSFLEKDIKTKIEFEKMPFVNIQKLKEEDKVNNLRKDKPFRFGQNIFVHINIKEKGSYDILSDGSKIWRLGIESTNALTINLRFENYNLSQGALLYVYNEDKSDIIGGFNYQNNQENGVFATTLVSGDKIIVEYFEPKEINNPYSPIITRVTHGYRGSSEFDKGFGGSGSCNMNVACPDGAPWVDDIRASARIISGGSDWCSGALINNTSEDGTPYFLTANHCFNDPSDWVFWFNWESETCANPGSSPSHDAISGSTLIARNSDSDFCLVLLNNTPPAEYEVYYSGWDNSDNQPSAQVGIHHPSGDIKKISFDDNPAVSSDYDPSPYLADSHWEITQWDRGTTTEGGSSGSPLYDENHRIIGQLHGGWASCSSLTQDYYGKFSMSWDRGGSPTNQLKDWLDPTNSGVLVLDGFDPNVPTVALDAQLLQISTPADTYFAEENITPTITIKNKGIDAITSFTAKYKIDTQQYIENNWTGTIASGETVEIVFPGVGITFGSHTFEALVTSPNGGTDLNTSNDTLTKVFNVVETIFNDDFETDKAWTMNGEWERNTPQGLGGEHGNADPTTAFGGTNVLGLDLTGQGSNSGDYEANLASHVEYAISPVINCSNFENIELNFKRWLGIEQASYDHAYIDISTDGSTWTELWTNTSTIAENAWSNQTIDISAYADEQASVQIRYSIGETDGSWFYCGWNIDNFVLTGTSITPVATISALPGCGAGTGTITVNSSRNGTQTFYLRNDAGSPISDWTGDANSHDFTGLNDGIYKGQVEKNGLMSNLSASTTLTNDLSNSVAPSSVSASETTVCAGTPTILSYTGGSGNTFGWYETSCGGTLVGNGNNLSVSPLTTTTYYGRWENSCANSSCETIEITVDNLITANAGNDDNTCDANYTLSGNSPSPGTGVWAVVSGTANISDINLYNSNINITMSPLTLSWTITNGACVNSDEVIITLENTTVITDQPDDINAAIGENVSFTVVATGDNLSYQWRKDGSNVGTNLNTLTLNNVQTSDGGSYDVVVSGNCGIETSDIAVLFVASNIENIEKTGIKVYPNPNNGIFNIDFPKETKNVEISIIDITGKLIYDKFFEEIKQHTLDFNKNKGVYFLQISYDNINLVSKIIIQ